MIHLTTATRAATAIAALALAAGLAGCTTPAGDTAAGPAVSGEQTAATAPRAAVVPANAAEKALASVIDDHWALTLAEAPTFASSLGDRSGDGKLPDPSMRAYEAGIDRRRALLARLEAIGSRDLDEDSRLNRALLMRDLEMEIEAADFGGKYMLLTNRSGPHLFLTDLPERSAFRTEADVRSYVDRLAAVPDYFAAATERLRAGITAGWVQPCTPMAGYEDSINVHVVIDPADSVFMAPFEKRPAAVSEASFASLELEAQRMVRERVIPAFRAFETFYNGTYQPVCRAEVGTDGMPGGEAYYRHRVRLFTTLDVTPDEVHDIGLSEVARIRAEMEEIARGEGYADLASFQRYLRSDPKFYPKTPEERMAQASLIAKKMDGQMVKLFGRLPRMPYDIREIPLDIAEKTTTAYYSRPAGDGSRAGTYWLNTTGLDQRPLYELEALTLHEAVPGHHHQIALSQELDLPDFRRYGGFTAFVEGWGLYSERLGLEAGFYETPYTNFGRLSYEMWRATRLVVDTGMHSKGWTRQEAIDFMLANTGLSRKNIEAEVDRYITWPGQALAYKMGELKIRELRTLAEQRLGADFDVRAFHDELLEAGAVPLEVLDRRMREWIEAQL